MALQKILFGDNQFFGVNHMSEEKARAQSMRFADNESIINVLDKAYAEGIKVFMCTTYDRVGEIAPGMYADIIAVHGNPLDDISELEDVDFVMKGGVVYKKQ